MAETQRFDIGIGDMLATGWARYRAAFVPVTAAGAVTFAVYGVFRWWSDSIDAPWTSFGVELLGLIVAGAVSLPWYRRALAAADGQGSVVVAADAGDMKAAFKRLKKCDGYRWIVINRDDLFAANTLSIGSKAGIMDADGKILKAADLPRT